MIFNCYINNENVLYITFLLKLLFVVITTIVFIVMETKCKYNKKKITKSIVKTCTLPKSNL